MSNVFEKGGFRNFRNVILNEELLRKRFFEANSSKISVFISHKHDDLDEIIDIISMLEKDYECLCYIDSEDATMPSHTNRKTAEKLRDNIEKCRKFILLATPSAMESCWCNWELGIGDVLKARDNNLALIFVKDGKEKPTFENNEYMKLYPYIVKREKGDVYSDNSPVVPGFYVRTYNPDANSYNIIELRKWLLS